MLLIVKKTKYVLFLIIVCLFPNVVHADCSYERMAELSRIASNVQFSYDYEFVDNTVKYYVNITNVTNDIYIIDSEDNEFRLKKEFYREYSFLNKVDFSIYSNDSSCRGEKILDKHISFPYYNEFSMLPECKEYPDFPLCGTWTATGNLIEDDFYKQFASYVNDEQEDDNDKSKKKSTMQVILDKLNETKFILLLCSLLIIILLFVLKKVKK